MNFYVKVYVESRGFVVDRTETVGFIIKKLWNSNKAVVEEYYYCIKSDLPATSSLFLGSCPFSEVPAVPESIPLETQLNLWSHNSLSHVKFFMIAMRD